MTTTTTAAAPTTGEEVLRRIEEIKPLLAANAVEGDKNRRASEESIEALTRAGAFRIGTPRRFGGLETSIRNQLDVSSSVAEADGGLGWITALANVAAWMMGLQGDQVQQDYFGSGPDVRSAGVLAPSCTAQQVEGGYIVNGKGYYASGSLHADWLGNGALVRNEAGEVVDNVMVFARRAEVEIEDTWFVAGMRASGSNCVVWKDVFVPAHRAIPVGPIIEHNEYPTPHKDEALYRAAFAATFVVVLLGPQLGLARAALDYAITQAAVKHIAYSSFGTQRESTAFQLRLARAATRIETAHLHTYAAADLIDQWAIADHKPTTLERAKIRAHSAAAVESVNEAINDLLFGHGAAGFAESSPLQRWWRDSNVGARHGVLNLDVSYESYGKALLGIDERVTNIL